MTFATRIAVTTGSLVLLTAAGLGVLAWRAVSAAVLPVELRRLERGASLAANELEQYIAPAREDVAALLDLPEVAELAGDRERRLGSAAGQRLARHFVRELGAKPQYVQFRLIGTQDGGREIVRVDRSGPGGAVRVVPEAELQAKGGRKYFQATIAVAPGRLYVSPIELNEEHGRVERPYLPVVRVAAPVRSAAGEALGILIVNVDLRAVLRQLRRVGPSGERLYLGGANGDFLLHPDSTREFASQLHGTADWRADFPDAVRLGGADTMVTAVRRTPAGNAVMAATAVRFGGGAWTTVVLTEPEAAIATAAGAVRRSIGWGALGFTAIAIALAVLLAQSLSRPVLALRDAVADFGRTGHWEPVAGGTGELALLSRSFTNMAHEVDAKRRELQHEVAERTRAEHALAAEAARLRFLSSVIESSDDAILTKTFDGIITSWNHAAERLYGYREREAVGQSIELVVPPEKRDELWALIAETRQGQAVRHLETVRVAKNGRLIDISLSLSPVYDEAGALIGLSAIARDITERKLAAERFRLAVEASPSGIVMVDDGGTMTLVNTETERLFGFNREELVGQPVERLLPSRFREQHPQLREAFAAAPARRAMGAGRELFGLRKDGTEFPVEVGLTPLRTRDRIMTLAVIIDITERRAAAEAAARYAAELERSNAELAQFAYVASHDLQEPLRMVSSYVDLLAQRYRGKLDERADKYIGYAVEGAGRMRALITDLLMYSRVGTQGKPLQPTDAGEVARETVRDLASVIEETGAEVEIGDLPIVMADPVQLGQVFQNLIGNAIKFRGDRRPRVGIAAEREGARWRLAVRDNGIGIAAEHAERIFEMFQRLHARGLYEGSGIGLALVRKIVERHGGKIWLESVVDEGSVFYFTMQPGPASAS